MIIDGLTYHGGFYDGLHPFDITFQEGSYTVNDKKYQRVNFESFDFVYSKGGGATTSGIYCASEQWEQAKAYYADSDNFVYYCSIGVQNDIKGKVPVVTEIPDANPKKFDTLLAFVDENRYRPFGTTNENTRRLPFPDSDESPELFFYKESKDGLFTSIRGYTLYVENDKLLLLYYHDYGHGKYEEMLVVDVPEELSQYFVELVANVANGQKKP